MSRKPRLIRFKSFENTLSKAIRFSKEPYINCPFHSTAHTLLQFVDQIYESVESSKYTIGVSIDLSIAFGTDHHNILSKKLEIYGILARTLVVWKLLK